MPVLIFLHRCAAIVIVVMITVTPRTYPNDRADPLLPPDTYYRPYAYTWMPPRGGANDKVWDVGALGVGRIPTPVEVVVLLMWGSILLIRGQTHLR